MKKMIIHSDLRTRTVSFNLQSHAIFLSHFPQSSSGVVFAVMGLMARFTEGSLVIVIQKLFPNRG